MTLHEQRRTTVPLTHPSHIRSCRLALTGLMTGLALLAIIKPAFTQSPEPAVVSGTVFDDRDRDGQRDLDEPGVGEVSVSDGQVTVETDARGRYSLSVDPE